MKVKFSTTIFVFLAIAALLALFLLLKPKQSVQAPQISQKTAVSPTPESKVKTFELVVKEKKLVSGPSIITVNQGDEVVIIITSDEEEELHLHGYDVSVDLAPNKQASLTFPAKISGRFPFELEKSNTDLGAVEVQPK